MTHIFHLRNIYFQKSVFLEVIALRNDYLKKLYYTASAVKKIQILRGQETEAHIAQALWAFIFYDGAAPLITESHICYYERKADITKDASYSYSRLLQSPQELDLARNRKVRGLFLSLLTRMLLARIWLRESC